MFRDFLNVAGNLVDDALFFAVLIGAAIGGLLITGLVVASVMTWSLPWNWAYWDSYNRQATNLTYIRAGGAPMNRAVVLDLVKVAPTDFVSPTCPFGGGDLFNPTGSVAQQVESGQEIHFLAGNSRQSITVPNTKIHQVVYPGKEVRVRLSWHKVVFYYDQNWDSLWADTGADGPKTHVINCMRTLSLGQKMLIGLNRATIFIPRHAAGSVGGQLPS